MNGQEARDDEREALIAEARREAGKWGPGPTATGSLLHRLADALERKRPEPEITDEMVDGAGHVLYASWGDWAEDDDWAEGTRALVRTALEAALRVPVGEVEQS